MKELTKREMEMMTEKELKVIALEKEGKRPVATKRALLAAEVLFERTHTTTATGELFPMGATGEFEEEVFREEFTF